MNRMWLILKREYLENVRTKAFIIGLVLTPVWMGVIFLVPNLMSAPAEHNVVIVDETGVLAEDLRAAVAEIPRPKYVVLMEPAAAAWDKEEGRESRIDELMREAGRGQHYLLVLTQPLLEKRPPDESKGEHAYGVFGPSSGTGGPGAMLAGVLNRLVTSRIVAEHELSEKTAKLIQKRATKFTAVTETGEAAGGLHLLLPILAVMLLYMGIVGISQMLISNTIEEKANRLYEVLLSSVSPFQLMSGKILGICAVGLTLISIWTGGGLVAAAVQGSGGIVSGAEIGWFIAFYLLGFLMIASLFVAVGSACNTIKEAQNLMAPLSMLLALPLILAMVSLQNPNGPVATTASFIPPFSPFVMMMRISSVPAPPPWQTWVALCILVLATYLTVRLAARVFRVGILLYGQPPSIKQIWRWMRARD